MTKYVVVLDQTQMPMFNSGEYYNNIIKIEADDIIIEEDYILFYKNSDPTHFFHRNMILYILGHQSEVEDG